MPNVIFYHWYILLCNFIITYIVFISYMFVITQLKLCWRLVYLKYPYM